MSAPPVHAASPGARPAGADDFGRIRSLLIETQGRTPPGWNWDIRRWDGWWFDREEPVSGAEASALVGAWETSDGRLAGAVHPEGPGEAYLELDPDDRHLEDEMLAWAEDHLAGPSEGVGQRRLRLWVLDDDTTRIGLLERRGYARLDWGGWMRLLRLAPGAAPVPNLPPPYRLRATTPGDDDCAKMADLLNASFGRASHTAREYRTFVDRSPSFEHDLNLVATAADGSFAAHAGFTHDRANRHAILEPVCTHPDHRRLGLARILILEGLRRLAARGAATVSVETGDGPAANRLYEECGFIEAHHAHSWQKTL